MLDQRQHVPAGELWPGVEFRHLATFAEIARAGSFRGAGERLGYPQSAISQQLHYLERCVGTRLIERSRGVSPHGVTPAGQLLLEHVATILERLGAAREELTTLVRGESGTLRVGAFQSVASRLLPAVLAVFASTHRDIDVAVTETTGDEELFGLVERGEIDLAFCQLPIADGSFVGMELFEDPFVLVAAPSRELTGREREPSLEEIGRMPLIGLGDPRAQERVLEHLRAHRVEPRYVFESASDATVQALVAEGVGVAIAPLLSVDPAQGGTVTIRLAELPRRRIALVGHRERPRPRTAERFAAVTSATCARWFERDDGPSATPAGRGPR